MYRVMIAFLLGIHFVTTGVLYAQECRVAPVHKSKAGLVAHHGTLQQMLSLLRSSNVDDQVEAGICCLACMPRVGTKVLVTDTEDTSYSIRVLEGPHRGCTGEIVKEAVTGCQE
jgi:hypothetical protein